MTCEKCGAEITPDNPAYSSPVLGRGCLACVNTEDKPKAKAKGKRGTHPAWDKTTANVRQVSKAELDQLLKDIGLGQFGLRGPQETKRAD